ncbi:developmental pluripotency-associated protein 3-like [Rattus norvegicus]|uniref:Developmental pluripotency-associated protein 3-like n=1 Tax=Rattus norvegicus TaxID=10116 RepID=D3ZQD9_RAT|nr:developmental pluripotency-associated protein 3-like [Rattus norvegicus]
MDKSSEKVDPVVNPETQMNDGSQREDEEDSPDDSEILQPETLVKVMKKLTLNPSAKPPKYHRHQRVRLRIKSQPVGNRSERIMREVQSAFPKTRVRTLLSVLKDPIARMRRFVRIEQRQRQLEGNERRDEPFRCLCTFCHYQRWDPSENAKIGQNQKN